ncbi:MAG: hypothetical protein ABIP55_05885 [Tepidisphaeraceae bacterium]
MRGWFRGFLALKALVAGVLILALWGRSYFVGDQVRRGSESQYVQLGSAYGSTIITFGHDGQRTVLGGSWEYVASKDPREMLRDVNLGDSVWNRLGFGFGRETFYLPTRGIVFNFIVPHWLIFLLAIPSAVRWVCRRTRRDAVYDDVRGPLECPTCGQTLFEIPPACPRCGQPLVVSAFR